MSLYTDDRQSARTRALLLFYVTAALLLAMSLQGSSAAAVSPRRAGGYLDADQEEEDQAASGPLGLYASPVSDDKLNDGDYSIYSATSDDKVSILGGLILYTSKFAM